MHVNVIVGFGPLLGKRVPAAALERVKNELQEFGGKAGPFDDITMMACSRLMHQLAPKRRR
jgi:hypothetical protein